MQVVANCNINHSFGVPVRHWAKEKGWISCDCMAAEAQIQSVPVRLKKLVLQVLCSHQSLRNGSELGCHWWLDLHIRKMASSDGRTSINIANEVSADVKIRYHTFIYTSNDASTLDATYFLCGFPMLCNIGLRICGVKPLSFKQISNSYMLHDNAQDVESRISSLQVHPQNKNEKGCPYIMVVHLPFEDHQIPCVRG